MHLTLSCCLLVFLLLSAAFYDGLTVTRYSVSTDKLDRPVTLVLLADLHSCLYGESQSKLIARIEEENPDLILMAGDIADDDLPHSGTTDLLAGIAKNYDCYYVTGNHEFWSGEAEEIKHFFRAYGVTVLEGAHRTVEINGQRINICGVDDPEIGEDAWQRQMEGAFASIDENLYTVLLSHRPERFDEEARYPCDLILSGHAHGGQWRIPGLLPGLFAPDQGFFPEYTAGLYELADVQMLVSRGLSRESTRVPRICNPPELVVLTIGPDSF